MAGFGWGGSSHSDLAFFSECERGVASARPFSHSEAYSIESHLTHEVTPPDVYLRWGSPESTLLLPYQPHKFTHRKERVSWACLTVRKSSY